MELAPLNRKPLSKFLNIVVVLLIFTSLYIQTGSQFFNPQVILDSTPSKVHIPSLNANDPKSLNELSSLETKRITLLQEKSNSSTINNAELSLFNVFNINSKISATYDIEFESISPEAMEKNASQIYYVMNFMITDAVDYTDPLDHIENLTISNSSITKVITTWFDWNNTFDDHYSLQFLLNDTVLSTLALGEYDLSFHVKIFAGGYHYSHFTIPLPMKDLQVVMTNYPSEFNNKDESDQDFNITFTVTENDGTVTNTIDTLPRINDSSGNDINPNVTIISSTGEDVGFLRFVDLIEEGSGSFTVTVTMNGSVAGLFEEGFHNLTIQVTSSQGISASDTISNFEAKGTTFLVKILTVQVNSNSDIDPAVLTNDSQLHVDFRLNLFDNFTITYEIYENSTSGEERSNQEHLLNFQDPNQAADPTAISTTNSLIDGSGTHTFSASNLTSVGGYILLFYVQGHKTSQSLYRSTNITIYWDQLKYRYTYQDDRNNPGYGGDYGVDYQEMALGLDVNKNWSLILEIFYASDNSPAITSQISYRFSDDTLWVLLTDGEGLDIPDGKFTILKTSSVAQNLSFTCNIENGSTISPTGTKFVNETISSSSFTLEITWTFLFINLYSSNSRLNLGDITDISATAYWAHDSSNQSFFTGIINLLDVENPGFPRDMVVTNGFGSLSGYFKSEQVGRYLFSVDHIIDSEFDVTTFANTSGHFVVQVGIIWDRVSFTFSDIYNDSLPVSNQSWGVGGFFTNFGENVSLYCHGWHEYDQAPFTGNATLINFNSGASSSVAFNQDGFAIWRGDESEARTPVLYRFWAIEKENNWNISLVHKFSSQNYVQITWEKVIITMVANESYKSGTWAEIFVYYEYEINESVVDPTNIGYDIQLDNETTVREDFSLTYFRDFSFGPLNQTYTVTSMIDYSNDLTATNVDVRYIWLDQGGAPNEGFLTIKWIDDEPPVIIESQIVNLNNGTILIVIIATDSSEYWSGSGIARISLLDTRLTPAQEFPQEAEEVILSSTQTLYIFRYSYDQIINSTLYEQWEGNEDYFQFNFNATLSFNVTITDEAGLEDSFVFEDLHMDADNILPEFLIQDTVYIKASFETIGASSDVVSVADGMVTISVLAQDNEWSGLSPDSVFITMTDLDGNLSESYKMNATDVPFERYSELLFEWRGILSVFKTYIITVSIQDIAGNMINKTVEIDILDVVGPQIKSLSVDITDDRKIEIEVEFEESGLGIDYVIAELNYSGKVRLINLSYQGGVASQTLQQRIIYSASIPISFSLEDIWENKDITINIITADKSGNIEIYTSRDLNSKWGGENNGFTSEVTSEALIFNRIVQAFLIFLFIIGVVVAIRVTSRVEGYDLKKIFSESEKIPREVILVQMDEYALGVTINFFDQVQGPVPVIWEPPLLEDQEQVMLDLSDKSFSILEFIGLDEYERSGTFDFSTGSYDCTALGYSFSVDNPQARGGKENLTVVLLLRKEWGDNLLVFQDELVEKLREIRNLIESKTDPNTITMKARELREFVSRLMISLDRLYLGSSLEKELIEE
jgi:hypothetical protein